jgi:hypothetical protein
MYHTSFDRYFSVSHQERLSKMKEDFAALGEKHDGGYLIMYTHPCRLFTSKFTDTFRHGKNPPREEWSPAPLRPDREISELQQDFDAFLGWVVKQSNVELTTYRELYEAHRLAAAPWLRAEEVLRLAALVTELNYHNLNGCYLSPAEQFGVVVTMVTLLETKSLPDVIPVRRLLGPTDTPPINIAADSLPADEFFKTARRVEEFCAGTGAVPANIQLGHKTIGPNAFMQAAAPLLTSWKLTKQVPQFVNIHSVSEYPAITEGDDFKRFKFKDSWTIFPPDFEGNNVLEMIRLQAWTAKPAEKKGRKAKGEV